MKIAIDISSIVYGTGVSTYTKNLVRSLLKIDKEDQYVFLGGSLRRKIELKKFVNTLKGNNFEDKILTFPPAAADIVWNRLHMLPIERLVGSIDVFHSSDWAQAPSKAYKITTIHDLVPIKYPQYSLKRLVNVHKRRLEWVKKEVSQVIVPSIATKMDAVDFGIDEERVKVIPEAPDHIFKPSADSEINRVKTKFGIKGKYTISVGVNPRKNTDNIIDAIRKLRKSKKYRDFTHVFIGHRYTNISKVYGIAYTGHVGNEDIATLYSGARALIYPSIYEGFGLPILEAFACKTPVVTSNVGSMREIGKGAAVLVNPRKVKSITNGIKEVLENRDKYIKSGLKKAAKYKWAKTAEMTLEVYQSSITSRTNSL